MPLRRASARASRRTKPRSTRASTARTLAQKRPVGNGLGGAEGHARGLGPPAPPGGAAPREDARGDLDGEHDEDDRGQMDDEGVEERPVAEPIRMFGGSPIRVAVPPMLEPSTCAKRKGKGQLELIGDDEGDRRDQQHGSDIVQPGGQHGGDQRQQGQRIPAGRRLGCRPERRDIGTCRSSGDGDQQHHADQQAKVLKSCPAIACSWSSMPVSSISRRRARRRSRD